MSTGDPIITTSQLSKRFWRHTALDRLDLEVPDGAIFALLGPNGAGKTTTLKLLLNLMHRTSGEARILGRPSHRLKARDYAQIGYVSQTQTQPKGLTLRSYLTYLRSLYPAWDDDLCARLIERFELPLKRKIGHLSRGQRVKVALLTALAYHPRLLLLDEPFGGLDPSVREQLIDGTLELVTEGDCTILLSSHEMDETERLADRVAFLHQGRLMFAEETEVLLERFRRIDLTFVAETDDSAIALSSLPECWLGLRHEQHHLQFVSNDFDADSTEREIQRHLPPTVHKTFTPMSLREIFLATVGGSSTSALGTRSASLPGKEMAP